MPGGPAFDSVQSYVAFAAIKFVGYTAAGVFFNTRFQEVRANPFLFGLTRTVIGMSLGAVVGLVGLATFELALLVFLLGLIPFRIAEWFSTLWVFYRTDPAFPEKSAMNVILGIVWSFGLDLPAIVGFIATGGFWIC